MSEEYPALYAARPAVFVNGEPQPDLANALQSLVLEETTAGLARCRARFINWGSGGERAGFVHFDSGLLAFGSQLSIEIGEGRAQAQVFEGRISAVEGRYAEGEPPAIEVYAEDRLESLRQARRTRLFEGARTADVIDEIAGSHGLLVQAALGGDDPVQAVIAQVDQTDLAFLRSLARRVQADLWLEGETLMVQARGAAGENFTLTMGAELRVFRVRADLSDQVTALGVAGWNSAGKAAIEELATDAVIATEVGNGLSGAAILQVAFGSRELWQGREVPLSEAEAQALAGARFAERAHRFVTGVGTTAGDVRLRVGKSVNLQGLGSWFDGDYSIVAVRHTFESEQGLATEFSVERTSLPQAAMSAYGKGIRGQKTASPGDKLGRIGREKLARPGRERPDQAETKIHNVLDEKRAAPDPSRTEQLKGSGEES